MIFNATHTHLYPGHRGTVSGLAEISNPQTGAECLVEFSDGSATLARLTGSQGDWQLDTDAYCTGAGTCIGRKCWLIRLEDKHGQVEFRILKKLTAS